MHRRRLDQNFHAKNRNEKSIKGSHTKAEKPGIVNPKPHTQLKPLDLDLKPTCSQAPSGKRTRKISTIWAPSSEALFAHRGKEVLIDLHAKCLCAEHNLGSTPIIYTVGSHPSGKPDSPCILIQ